MYVKEELERDYAELKSIRKLAAKYNIHHKTMSQWLRNFNIEYQPKLTRTKNDNIFSEENETSFYLAGFIAADGNVIHRDSNYHLNIRLGIDDLDHLMVLQKLLGSNSKISEIKDHESEIAGRKIISSTKGFVVCSKQIYEDLNKNFLITENKSLSLKFPQHLANHKLINHFIRGYFDGDGSFSIRNPTIKNKQSKINVCFELVGSKYFISTIQLILNNQMSLPKNKIEVKNNIYRIRYSGNRLSSLIGDWLYQDATIYLQRKCDRYQLAKELSNK